MGRSEGEAYEDCRCLTDRLAFILPRLARLKALYSGTPREVPCASFRDGGQRLRGTGERSP
jgi:hypothetical protein